MITFMDLFNDMYIEKYRADGSTRLYRVPIQFANREKWLQQIQSRVNHVSDHDGNFNNAQFEIDMILPRLSVNLMSLTYDTMRKVNKNNTIKACEPCSLNQLDHQYTNAPSPWNLELEFAIISKNMDDGLQLLEQIIPYFQPSLSVNIKFLEGYAADSVPVILESVTPAIEEDLDDNMYRHFTWILNFRMKVNFHLPKRLKGRIKDIIYNIHPNDRGAEPDQLIQYQLAAEEFDVVHDSTSFYAMTFEAIESGGDPNVKISLWKDESIPKLVSEFGNKTYEWASVRSEGALETIDGPCFEYVLEDIDGNGNNWAVSFEYNIVTVLPTDVVSPQQFVDIVEKTTGSNFRLAVQGGELIVVSA